MLNFSQYVEAIAIPRSMGTAKQTKLPASEDDIQRWLGGTEDLPSASKMRAWSVSYVVPSYAKTVQVTATSEAEVRRMLWEYLKQNVGRNALDKNGLVQAAKMAEIKPIGTARWNRLTAPAPAPEVMSMPQQRPVASRTG